MGSLKKGCQPEGVNPKRMIRASGGYCVFFWLKLWGL
jgi:hypothetical protein